MIEPLIQMPPPRIALSGTSMGQGAREAPVEMRHHISNICMLVVTARIAMPNNINNHPRVVKIEAVPQLLINMHISTDKALRRDRPNRVCMDKPRRTHLAIMAAMVEILAQMAAQGSVNSIRPR